MKKITWYYIDTFKEVINLIPISNHENERMTFLRKSERDKKYVVIKQIKIIDNYNGNNNYSTILKELYFLSTVKKNRYFVEIIDVLLSEDLEHIFLILREEGVDFKVHIKKKFDYNKQIPGISRRIFFQVACGLKILHENGLCHNDIKPENIVTSPTGKAKLCDMGSVDKNEGIQNGGTKGYLSPQALLGKPRTKEDDMWSLGVVFLELLIKKDSLFFFEDSDYREVLKKLLEKFYDLKLKVPKRNDDILDDIIQYISDNNYNSFEYKLKFDFDKYPNIEKDDKKLIRNLLEINPDKRMNAEKVLNLKMFRGIFLFEHSSFNYVNADYDKYIKGTIPDKNTFLKYIEEIRQKFVGQEIFD